MFIWVHATSSTWQNRTISVSSYVATSKPWAAPPFSPQLSGMSTWPTRKSSTFMVGPMRSRSIFQGLRRFQFHCQSRHYGGQQKQKVRTVRWLSKYHHKTVAQKRKSDLSFSVSGADLRWKSRRIIVDDTAPVRAAGVCLSEDNYLSIFEGEIRRQEYFNFHSIRITFAGAGTVCDGTETGIAGFLFLWWSSKGWKLYDAQSSKLNESERRPSGLCYVSTRLAVENL